MIQNTHKTKEETDDHSINFNEDIYKLDALPENAALYSGAEITRAQEILGEAIEHLQGRQREVYMLVMRDSLSYNEAAEILKLSKAAVQIYIERAKKFLIGYCRAVAKKEGLL